MGFFHEYPYTDFHEMNLDWLLKSMKGLSKEMQEFVQANTIKYADPIDWSSALEYEKAVIVMDPNGDSYLSLQHVPIGTSIYNTDYWQKIASFNAQLIAQNRKKYIVMGDSYAESPSTAVNWTSIFRDCLRLTDDVNCFRGAFSGCGFSVNGVNGFLTGLQSFAGNVGDPDLITDIVVCGGANDVAGWTDGLALRSGIQNFIDYAKSIYKNAVVHIGYIGYFYFGNQYVGPNATIEMYFNVMNVYKTNGIELGAEFLTGVEQVMHDLSLFSADNLHPNTNGAIYLGRAIANAVRTGVNLGYNYSAAALATPTATGDTFNGVAADAHIGTITIADGRIRFDLFSFGWTPASPWITDPNNFKEFGTLNTGGIFMPNKAYDIPIMAACVFSDVEPSIKVRPFTLRFMKDKMYLRTDFIDGYAFDPHNMTTFTLRSRTIFMPVIDN